MDNTTGTSWFDTIGNLAARYAEARYVKPYEVQSMRAQGLGQNGYYVEGKANVSTQGSTSTLLLVGAAVVALLLLKD